MNFARHTHFRTSDSCGIYTRRGGGTYRTWLDDFPQDYQFLPPNHIIWHAIFFAFSRDRERDERTDCHDFANTYTDSTIYCSIWFQPWIGFGGNLVGAGCSEHRRCSSSILMGSAVYTEADENGDALKIKIKNIRLSPLFIVISISYL